MLTTESSETAEAVTDARGADRKTADASNSWLGKRLRVFERLVGDVVARQTQSENDNDAAIESVKGETEALRNELRELTAGAQASIKKLQDNLDELAAHCEASEEQHRAAVCELQTSLGETDLRVQTTESVARAALVENSSAHLEPPPFVREALDEEPVGAALDDMADAVTPEPQASYLSAARASALAAAVKRDETEAGDEIAVPPHRYIREIVTAVVVLAIAGVLGLSLWSERAEAENQVARSAAPAVIAVAGDAPLDFLTQSAEAGDATSELAVALKYLNGEATTRDPIAGLRWMNRAAKHGAAVAQYMLGYLYEKGSGAAVDPFQAMRWYEAAALHGNRKAMHNLAVAYARGLDGTKSPEVAARWFSRAAGFGYVDSQFDLAVLYERGEGVPQNLIDAYKWYAIAARQGDAESETRLEALRTQLSPAEVAAAQHAANAFRALPYDVATNVPPRG